jgi:anthranilate phosphoribosyltransferase
MNDPAAPDRQVLEELEQKWLPMIANVQQLLTDQRALVDRSTEFMQAVRRGTDDLIEHCDLLKQTPTSISGEAFELYMQRLYAMGQRFREVTAMGATFAALATAADAAKQDHKPGGGE